MSVDPSHQEMTVPIRLETLPDDGDPAAFGRRCHAHQFHQPEPRYLEAHHVIPRAWQAFWRPQPDGSPIWAPDTALLCRTGHGNVHYWIERAMRAYPGVAGREPRSEAAITRAFHEATTRQMSVGRRERLIAEQALLRYEAAGGSLQALCDAGVLGGIYGRGA